MSKKPINNEKKTSKKKVVSEVRETTSGTSETKPEIQTISEGPEETETKEEVKEITEPTKDLKNDLSKIAETADERPIQINSSSPETSPEVIETEKKDNFSQDLFGQNKASNEGEQPKKKRGPKGPRKPKGIQQEQSAESNKIDFSQYQPAQVETSQPNEVRIELTRYVSGGLLLIMIDSVFPLLVSFVYPKVKRLKDKRSIKLSKEEREELKPLADEAIKAMSLQMSPVEGFLLVLAFMYGGKVMMLSEEDFIPEETDRPIKKK